MNRRIFAVTAALLFGCGCFRAKDTAVMEAQDPDLSLYTACSSYSTFQSTVVPVLTVNCLSCHQNQSPYILKSDPAASFKASLKELLSDDGGDPTLNPLTSKATGGGGHTGGAVLQPTSSEYGAMVNWILEERTTPCSP